GTLYEHGLQPGGATTQAGGFSFAGTLVLAGAQPGPGDQMSGSREAAHITADLGEDRGCRQQADARDRTKAGDQVAKGRLSGGRLLVHAVDLLGDPLIELAYCRIDGIPLLEMQLQQKTMLIAQPA